VLDSLRLSNAPSLLLLGHECALIFSPHIVVHGGEIGAIFTTAAGDRAGTHGEVLRFVQLVAIAFRSADLIFLSRHYRLVAGVWVETFHLLEVEHSGVARRRAHRVVQVVESHEQNLVQSLLSLCFVLPDGLEVEAEVASHLALALMHKLHFLSLVSGVDLYESIVLFQ